MLASDPGFDNPFAFAGNKSGFREDRFVGRTELLGWLRQKLLSPSAYGSAAITGQPRSGKTWLAKMALTPRHLQAVKATLLWFTLSDYDTAEDFTSALLRQLSIALQRIDHRSEAHEFAVQHLSGEKVYWEEVVYFFEMVVKETRPVVVLDEFDAAKVLFNSPMQLNHVRSLCDHLPVLLISKWRLSWLGERVGDYQYWQSVVNERGLPPFDAGDFRLLCDGLTKQGVVLDQEQRAELARCSGSLPYFVQMFAFSAAAALHAGEATWFESALHTMDDEQRRHFGDLVGILRESHRFTPLVEVVRGPLRNLTNEQVSDLQKYALLSDPPMAMCPALEAVVRAKSKDLPIWPELAQCELRVRRILEELISDRYPECASPRQWEPKLRAEFPAQLTATFEKATDQRKREGKHSPESAHLSLLHFLYPIELFEVMRCDWKNFGSWLDRSKSEGQWRAAFETWQRARPLPAHVREWVASRELCDRVREVVDSLNEQMDKHTAVTRRS